MATREMSMSLAMRSYSREMVLDRLFHHHSFRLLSLCRLLAHSRFACRTLDSSERANILIICSANGIQYRQTADEFGEMRKLMLPTSFLSLSRRLRNFAAQLAPAMLCGHYCLRESARQSSRGSTLANLIRSKQAIDTCVHTS